MRARGHGGHQDHMAGKNVEQRQRTHDIVLFAEQQAMAQPTVVDQAGIFVLRHLRHAGGAPGVEIASDTVFLHVLEIERGVLFGDLSVEVEVLRLIFCQPLGPDQWHDPAFRRCQIADKVHLKHRMHLGRKPHRFGGLLRHVRLGERPQGDHDGCTNLAQDGTDLFGIQQRIDRADDPRNGTAQQGDSRLVTVWQHVGHHVFLTNTEAAEKVGGLCHAAMQLAPGQRFGLVFGP